MELILVSVAQPNNQPTDISLKFEFFADYYSKYGNSYLREKKKSNS